MVAGVGAAAAGEFMASLQTLSHGHWPGLAVQAEAACVRLAVEADAAYATEGQRRCTGTERDWPSRILCEPHIWQNKPDVAPRGH